MCDLPACLPVPFCPPVCPSPLALDSEACTLLSLALLALRPSDLGPTGCWLLPPPLVLALLHFLPSP